MNQTIPLTGGAVNAHQQFEVQLGDVLATFNIDYRTLTESATQRLEALKITNARIRVADGRDGMNGEGLFDRIVANGSFDGPPRQFLDQLASGGMMLAAIGPAGKPQMFVRLTKVGSRFDREDLFPVRFQPLEEGRPQIL